MGFAMSEVSSTRNLGLVDGAVRDTVARLLDENERLKAQITELERLADSDQLTPLPNRRAFVREAERAIARVARYGAPVALMYVDVDNLKSVNEAHGHAAGDAALNHLAGLLRAELRAGDFVARIGGDEFALIVDPVDAEAADAKAAALRRAATAAAFAWQGVAVPIGISIGIAMIDAADTVDALLARADARMYAAKAGQRSDK
jgi:diguanylate cyclase (GGDEF)-like protein